MKRDSGWLVPGSLGLHRSLGLEGRLGRRGGAVLVGLHVVLVLVLAEGLHHDCAERARRRYRLHGRRQRERPGLDARLRSVRGILEQKK